MQGDLGFIINPLSNLLHHLHPDTKRKLQQVLPRLERLQLSNFFPFSFAK